MTRVKITIGLVLTIATVAIIGIIGIQEPARLEDTAEAQRARSIEVGAELFESQCTECHGDRGEGKPGVAPCLNCESLFEDRLDEVGYQGSMESFLELTIAGGRPVKTDPQWGRKMPTWGKEFGGPLEDYQIEDLVAFIMNWESTAGEPMATPAPVAGTPVERGEAFFVSSNIACGACHTISGVEGATGTVGPDLSDIATVAADRKPDLSAEEYIRESILQPNAHIVEGFQEGVMPQDFSNRLSDQQLDDIIAFLMEQQ